ncbi:MAG: glycosyl hydrolase [Tepidisphaerales bacterium]
MAPHARDTSSPPRLPSTPMLLVVALFLGGCATRAAKVLSPAAAELEGGLRRTEAAAGTTQPVFVTGFAAADDRLVHRVRTPGGLYELALRYRAGQPKLYVLQLNGEPSEGYFMPSGPDGDLHVHGLVELPPGESVLSVGGGWGHYDVGEVVLRPVSRPPPPSLPAYAPADPLATAEARELLRFLQRHYGRVTFTGVYSTDDIDHVRQRSGHTPAALGGDLMDYSPSRVERGADARGETERLIAAARRGHLITVSWHWNAPRGLLDRVDVDDTGREVNKRWYKGFYTNATTFDLAAAVADPESEDYALLLRDIDAIAVELRKFADARVPVLWRPLHEAEGGWFWWGAKGPEPYVRLWRLLYDRLTRHHGLHNLLWVYTAGPDPSWYPGDDVVDVVGADLYPADIRDTTTWGWSTLHRQYGRRKLIALTEVGFVPDVDRMHRLGIRWAYYTTWTQQLGPRRHTDAELRSRLTESRFARGLPPRGPAPPLP